jgi:hypothetical protein
MPIGNNCCCCWWRLLSDVVDIDCGLCRCRLSLLVFDELEDSHLSKEGEILLNILILFSAIFDLFI